MQRTPHIVRGTALAAIALAASFGAQAQSSVTLYGIVDMFVQYGKGDSTTLAVQSGGVSSSRLGFKGTEDLGGGLKANFQLEQGILADTGALGNGGLGGPELGHLGLAERRPPDHPPVRHP